MSLPPALQAWHELVDSKNPAALADLLADDVVFRSPAIFKPQEGKALTTMYLTAALTVLGETLVYVNTWLKDDGAVLEFTADLDGVLVNGVDMISWNDAGKITGFTVMLRPMRGLQTVMGLMQAQLEAAQL